MATPQTAQTSIIDIPLGGINVKDPVVGLPFNYSPYMTNWIAENQYLRARNGITRYCAPVTPDGIVLELFTFGDPSLSTSKLYAYVQNYTTGVDKNQIWDVSSSTPSQITTAFITAKTADLARCIPYKGRIGLSVESAASTCSARFDGTTWASLGFTNGGSDIAALVGLLYRGHVYLFSGTSMYYTSTVGAVTGAMTKVDLADFFPISKNIFFAAVLSSPGSRASETYLVIGGDAGEILMYGGEYPDSGTWSIVGQYKVPPLAGYNAIIEFNNDLWIMTSSAIVSMRDLMTMGSRATEDQAVSSNINTLWTNLMTAAKVAPSGAAGVSGAFWPEQNKIFIFLKASADLTYGASTTESSMLVYNIDTQAWSYLTIPSDIINPAYAISSLTYYRNALYLSCADTIMKMGTSGYKDEAYNDAGEYYTFTMDLYSGHSNLGKNGKKKVIGWNALFDTDFVSGSVGIRSYIDVGRKQSGNTLPAFQSGANSIDFLTGGHGELFQYFMSLSSSAASTDGFKLYSMGVIL